MSSLLPYAKNARIHSEAQVAQLAASIEQWGWTVPILVDEKGGIIAGHGRVMAAKRLGLVDVPVMVAAGWTEAQRQAYVIADNKLAANADWDDDLLRAEFTELRAAGFDLGVTGFEAGEIAELFSAVFEPQADPEEVPEPPAAPVSALGDVWILGKHRLACGSSTEAAVVAAVLAGTKPHLMVTDPPYGVEYDASWRNVKGLGSRAGAGAVGKVLNDDQADWREAWALFPGDVAYVWHADRFASVVQGSLLTAGFEVRCQIIWAKQQFAIGRGDYHFQHEPCWYAVRKGKTGHWAGGRKQTTLWEIPKPAKSETGHSTQKPIECMRRPILNNSKAGDAVYEPFMGSGTTLIAAEITNRVCYGIELNPAYVDVAVLRWQGVTGREATLESTNETFAEAKASRGQA